MSLQRVYTAQSGAISCDVELDHSLLVRLAGRAQRDFRQRAFGVVMVWAEEVTAWMKENRPWRDHTERAKDSLGVLIEFRDEVLELIVTGGVFYQKYLELYHGGRYAILKPAFDVWEPVLRQRLGYEVEDEH